MLVSKCKKCDNDITASEELQEIRLAIENGGELCCTLLQT